jgi:prepilin-type N-terminal cleavage/methylation domain-containing protein
VPIPAVARKYQQLRTLQWEDASACIGQVHCSSLGMRGGCCRSCHGFSLVEVLVAVAVLVAGAMALVPLFMLATSANASARHTTYATVLAAQKLEELRALEALPSAASHVEYVDRLGEPRLPGEAAYLRRWSIEPLPADASGTLVVIEVAVAPRTGRGDARLVTVHAGGGP